MEEESEQTLHVARLVQVRHAAPSTTPGWPQRTDNSHCHVASRLPHWLMSDALW